MKKALIPFFLLLCSFSYGQNFSGDWEGMLSVGGNKLPLVFHLKNGDTDSLTGTWDSPMQGASGLSFTMLKTKGDSVFAEVKNIGASFTGKLVSPDSISGDWRQSGVSFPLGMKKGKEATQSPNKNEHEIDIPAFGKIKLSGSLISKNKTNPLVIIIAGSGPTDRNGNSPLGVHADTYLQLANSLDSQNISSFRYDKRGIGKSAYSGMKESDLRFDDYVNDVDSIVQFFKRDGYSRIFLAGHSEGSLLGMIAAAKEKVNGYISVSGVGVPAGEIIKKQLSGKVGGIADSTIDRIVDNLEDGHEVKNVPAALTNIFRPSIQPYLINWFSYDPANEIKKVNCPILILQGTCDIQVGVDNAKDLYDEAKNAELKIIQNMSHVLKDAGKDCENQQRTYIDNSIPVSPELIKVIVQFVKIH